ncbi:glycosyltransferase family 4 protein [Nocardioides sp. KR10-350]|uniref:glycosyltransferase family 4 protein n=1 Tax=Nocardioides cheoyonin TaxID=3156615 RepID=UPI0032B5C5D4
MRSLRILQVHGRYRSQAPSGENQVVDREAALLREAGHHVAAFERHSDDIAGFSAARKAVLPLTSVHDPSVRLELAGVLRARRPDVVHVHNTFPLLSPSVLLACRDAGVPVVATLHNYKLLCASGDFFRDGRPCHDCADGSVAPAVSHGCYRGSRAATLPIAAGLLANRELWRTHVAAYLCISASQRDLLAGLRLPPERVRVVHNFVAAPLQSVPVERDHTVVSLSRLDAPKGARFLTHAWDAFRAVHPASRLRLVIAGSGPLEPAVRRWARRHDSVQLLGTVRPEEAHTLLARATAAVVPSQWEETFGLVAIEAMAAGVAPIAPARGSFPEIVTDGVDGTLYRAEDHRDLARVLAEVDSTPQRYLDLGHRARATHAERFAPAAHLEQLLAAYDTAIRLHTGLDNQLRERAGAAR